MSQLELPPISFARYLDLLKRRRWQVIPMSLAGLLVGAVVAFLIPRYYVATTSVSYAGPAIDTKDVRDSDDPLQLAMVDAIHSVELWVPDALTAIGVLGSDVEPDVRQSRINSHRARTEVRLDTPRSGNRTGTTMVTIQYKDVEGQRSADFANALRKAWLDGVHAEALTRAQAELTAAQNAERAARDALDQHLRDLRTWLTEQRIEVIEDKGKLEIIKSKDERMDTVRQEIDAARTGIALGQTRIDELQSLADKLPTDVPQALVVERDPTLASAVASLQSDLAYWEKVKEAYGPSNPSYGNAVRTIERINEQLRKLNPGFDPSGTGTQLVPNPQVLEYKRRISEYRIAITEHERKLQMLEPEFERLQKDRDRLPAAYEGLRTREANLDFAKEQVKRADAAVADLTQKFEKIRAGGLFRENAAFVPAAPTDPNIVLVALIGAVLGLGAAIGLVLLLDVMRSNFKTVHDVEYALSIPVLGVMSHLETDEERVETHRQRRRIAIAAASFLVVSFSVVAIYYLDPTRLPLVVYDALQMILGPAQ